MLNTQRPWLFGPKVSTDTTRQSVRLSCSRGHAFRTEIATCINLRTDSALLKELALTGLLTSPCPACGIDCQIASPVFLSDPDREQSSVFIPTQISYLELYLRAIVAQELLDAESQLPAYMGNCDTLVGTAALVSWQDGEGRPKSDAPAVVPSNTEQVEAEAPPKKKSDAPNKAAKGPQMSIMDAFADLDGAEDERRTSIPPDPEDMDVDDDADDDWLDDNALNTATGQKKKPKTTSFIPTEGGK